MPCNVAFCWAARPADSSTQTTNTLTERRTIKRPPWERMAWTRGQGGSDFVVRADGDATASAGPSACQPRRDDDSGGRSRITAQERQTRGRRVATRKTTSLPLRDAGPTELSGDGQAAQSAAKPLRIATEAPRSSRIQLRDLRVLRGRASRWPRGRTRASLGCRASRVRRLAVAALDGCLRGWRLRQIGLADLRDDGDVAVRDAGDLVLDRLADEHVHRTLAETEVVVQPVMQFERRMLERLQQVARGADGHQVVLRFDARPSLGRLTDHCGRADDAAVRPFLLLDHFDAELDVERRLDAGAGDAAVALARVAVAEEEQCAGLEDRQHHPCARSEAGRDHAAAERS